MNYDIYIKENNEHYKVSADWASCFNYEDFTGNVKENHLIQIRIINNSNLITNSDIRSVVALSCNGREYLNMDCVNASIEDNKWFVKLYWVFAVIAVVQF